SLFDSVSFIHNHFSRQPRRSIDKERGQARLPDPETSLLAQLFKFESLSLKINHSTAISSGSGRWACSRSYFVADFTHHSSLITHYSLLILIISHSRPSYSRQTP